MSQTTKLMGSYIRVADTTVLQSLPLVCVLGSIVAIMAAKAALFAVLFALFSVLYIVIATFVSHPVRRIGAEHAATESTQTGNLADAITNVMAVKASPMNDTSSSASPRPPSAPGTHCSGYPARTCGRWPGSVG